MKNVVGEVTGAGRMAAIGGGEMTGEMGEGKEDDNGGWVGK